MMKDLFSLVKKTAKEVIDDYQDEILSGTDNYYTKAETEQLIQDALENLLDKLNEAINNENE